MSHILLVVFVISLSLGFGLTVLAFLFSRRYRSAAARKFGFIMLAGTLLIVVEGLKAYEHALRFAMGPLHAPILALLLAVASGLLAYLLPLACLDLVGLPAGRLRRVVQVILCAAAAALGGLTELADSELFWKASFLLLAGIHGYALWIVAPRLSRISNLRVRSLVRTCAVILGVHAPFALAQVFLHGVPSMPPAIRNYPLEPLAYFLTVAFVLYLYAGRFLVAPSVPADFTLSEEAARRFGISPREREIVSLVLQGYNHRQIGERLLISAQTVKNHVYNIYQKTSVENRVQLLNLLHPPNH